MHSHHHSQDKGKRKEKEKDKRDKDRDKDRERENSHRRTPSNEGIGSYRNSILIPSSASIQPLNTNSSGSPPSANFFPSSFPPFPSASSPTEEDPSCGTSLPSSGSTTFSTSNAGLTYVSTFGLLPNRLPRPLDGNTRFVRLNVGGREFITTTETLCKEESMLAAMVRHHQRKPPETGGDVSKHEPLFIDRDGTHFQEILNYLRNGALDPLPVTEEHWRALAREADFYGISSLLEILKLNSAKTRYKFYVMIKGSSFYNCQVYPPPKSYEKRHSNPCNMVSCLNAHLRDGFEIEEIVWPTISSDACQAILYKWMVD